MEILTSSVFYLSGRDEMGNIKITFSSGRCSRRRWPAAAVLLALRAFACNYGAKLVYSISFQDL